MTDALKKLKTYAKRREALPQDIRDARKQGHTWEQISEAANMSRAAVIKASKRD